MMSPLQVATAELTSLRPVPGFGAKTIYRGVVPRTTDAAYAGQLRLRGITTLIDLRELNEISREPLGDIPGVRYRGIPLYCGQNPSDRTLSENQRLLLDGRGARLIAALRVIGQPTDGNTAVVCQSGGKRTGLVIALLLEAMGVTRELIIADFASAVREPGYGLPGHIAATMNDTLNWLVESYGSVTGYLLSKGLTGVELHRLLELGADARASTVWPLAASS
ncbi:tyrosine-protein phosphatase [Glutamicibacter bergerei]